MIRKWAMTQAEWWQFWMPQSGLMGGVIFGAILEAIIFWSTK